LREFLCRKLRKARGNNMKKISFKTIFLFTIFINIHLFSENQNIDVNSINVYNPRTTELHFDTNDKSGRIELLEAEMISSKFIFEPTILSFVWGFNDSFNKNKANWSFFPFLQYLYFSRYIKDRKIPLIYYLNSKYHFLFFKSKKEPSIHKISALSLYFKNNTDFYFFRKNKWLQFSQGIGINWFIKGFCYFRIGYLYQLGLGIEKNDISDSINLSFG